MTKKNQAKSTPSKGLGKGLSSLLGDNNAIASMGLAAPAGAESVAVAQVEQASVPASDHLPIEKITAGPWQPRQQFDEENLNDLAESIRQHGVVQPLLVRPDGNKYQLIAGERRWRAAQRAGLHEVPVVIRDASDKMAAEIAMIENIQRHDLSSVEEAEGYRRLIDEFEYTQDALAKVIGKSRSHLANTMRLLNLPDGLRKYLREGKLTAGQVRPLIGRDDAEELGAIVLAKGLSARQVEAMVAQKEKPVQEKPARSADIVALEEDLRNASGFDINIKFNPAAEKGMVTIKLANLEQFDALVATLKNH